MQFSKAKNKIEQLVVPHIPLIRNRIEELANSAGIKTKELLENEEAMQRLFHTVHGSLPFVARMAIKEQAFVEFCLRNRDRLLTKVPQPTQQDEESDSDK